MGGGELRSFSLFAFRSQKWDVVRVFVCLFYAVPDLWDKGQLFWEGLGASKKNYILPFSFRGIK